MSKLAIYVMVVFQSLTWALAGDASAQRKYLKELTVDLNLKTNNDRVALFEIIDEIESSSEFRFAYSKRDLKGKEVSITSSKWNMLELLTKISTQNRLRVNRYNETITLVAAKDDDELQIEEKVVDPIDVTGTVTDEEGNGLPGVSVVVRNTSNGTITDVDGNFRLEVDANAVLEFSFIGYAKRIVELNGRSKLDISMEPDIQALEEVVVVGYGAQKKKDLTGSVVSADLESFKNAPNTNIMQSLQGTIPGLNIGQVSSAGSTPSIQIRGRTTLNGNQNVLIILDGIQYNSSLSSINPDDIASIDVLKDASAKAVYGAQAANGVIVITTKKGKKDQQPDISFSTSYTTQAPTKDRRPMKREQYLNHIRDLYWDLAYDENANINEEWVQNELPKQGDISDALFDGEGDSRTWKDNDYDWWDEGTDPGFIQKNQLSVKGGSNNLSYLMSAGLTRQQGFIKGDEFERKSLRVNLESQVTNWLKVGVQSFGSFVNQDGAEPNLSQLLRQSPLVLPYDEEGNLVVNPFNTLDENPFLGSDVDDYERHNYFFANVYTDIDIPFIQGLSYRMNFGNNYRLDKNYRSSIYGAGQTGSAYKNNSEYYDYTFDNILTYKRDFGNNHSLTATLLHGVIERQSSSTNANSEGFSRLTLGYNDLNLGEIQQVYSSAWSEALAYQMARINYKFANKYLITATLRRDGFSGFAENNKYGLFPSLALGWVLTEDFVLPQAVDFVKVRAGYGVSGNQTGRYSSLARVSTNQSYVFGDGGTTLFGQETTSLANNDLSWEKTIGYNVGLDFDLLASRISGSIDYYHNNTTDLLNPVSLPSLSGFSSIQSNVGELNNQGLEVMLSTVNVNNDKIKWTTTFTFALNRNKIVSLLGEDNDGDGVEDDLVADGLFIGEPIDAIYDLEIDGIYQLDDSIPSGYLAGTYKIVDQQDTGAYNINLADDRIILGNRLPAYRAGILSKLEYKGFSLSVFINTIQGGKRSYLGNNTQAITRGTNALIWNYYDDIDYWSPGNPDGEYPRSVGVPAQRGAAYYDRSFVRLQDVILAYTFPKRLLDKINVKNMDVFVSGKNLATWTDWKGWDPETGAGLGVGSRPVMKGYSVGLNITL